MKVTTYTINEGTASQYYGLKSVSENHVLHKARSYKLGQEKRLRGGGIGGDTVGRKATKTPEELAAARTKYKNTWQRENKDRIPITVPAGDKDRIAAWAKSRGYPSTNAYITDLVYKDMGER